MSAFSRGLLSRAQCSISSTPISHHFFLRNNFQQPRFLSLNHHPRVAPKFEKLHPMPRDLLKAKPSVIPTNSQSAILKSYKSYAETLSAKTHATLLYQAPSHTALWVAAYGTGLFCFTYAAISYNSTVLHAPPGIAWWIPHAFSLISVMMACCGTWMILTPHGIIKTISAIPKAKQVQIGKKAFTGELQLEVELKKMLPVPFFPARKIYIPSYELQFAEPIVSPAQMRMGHAERARQKKLEEEARKKAWEYDQAHLLTSPFRHMSRGAFQAFTAMKRTFTRDGFMKVKVADTKYKLDVSDGWALDGGRALDRLATKKPQL